MSSVFHELQTIPKNRFEQFIHDAERKGHEVYRAEIKGNGGFEFTTQIRHLIELSNKINARLLVYLFGERTGMHLAEKYVECGRNLLAFLGRIDNEYQFFILHELKTNVDLFAHA